jgi:hypothetical protein
MERRSSRCQVYTKLRATARVALAFAQKETAAALTRGGRHEYVQRQRVGAAALGYEGGWIVRTGLNLNPTVYR